MTDPFDALTSLGFVGWSRDPLRGDASARQFMRLRNTAGQTAIAMYTPPALSESQIKFTRIARLLKNQGIAAPAILANSGGLIVMEDLGLCDFAQALEQAPDQDLTLYRAAIDVLITVQSIPQPDGLPRLSPDEGAQMLDPFFENFAAHCTPEQRADITDQILNLMALHTAGDLHLSLRDYHAENLIWRAERTGTDRVGVVDFQDAFLAPGEYDLVSLLRDARRDVSPELRADGISYFAQRTGQDLRLVATRAAVLGLQRNLRILGIFARLAQREGKASYLRLVPRVRQHVRDDLGHAALRDIAPLLEPLLEGAA